MESRPWVFEHYSSRSIPKKFHRFCNLPQGSLFNVTRVEICSEKWMWWHPEGGITLTHISQKSNYDIIFHPHQHFSVTRMLFNVVFFTKHKMCISETSPQQGVSNASNHMVDWQLGGIWLSRFGCWQFFCAIGTTWAKHLFNPLFIERNAALFNLPQKTRVIGMTSVLDLYVTHILPGSGNISSGISW